MQFLKYLFWCLIAFLAAIFTWGNWTRVDINLWAGTTANVNLPFLLLVTFLIGFLPTYIYYHAVRWRLRSRLAGSERTLADARAALSPAPRVDTPPPVADSLPPAL